MFIPVNQGAIKVFLIALFLFVPIWICNRYNIIEDEPTILIGSWILVAASYIGTKLNFEARVLYIIPTSLITLPIALYVTASLYTSIGYIGKLLLIGFVILIFVILLISFVNESKRIAKLEITEIILPKKSDGMLNYWQSIKDLFFFPTFTKHNLFTIEYNINVVRTLQNQKVELYNYDIVLNELKRVQNSIAENGTEKLDKKIIFEFINQINHNIKTWQSYE